MSSLILSFFAFLALVFSQLSSASEVFFFFFCAGGRLKGLVTFAAFLFFSTSGTRHRLDMLRNSFLILLMSILPMRLMSRMVGASKVAVRGLGGYSAGFFTLASRFGSQVFVNNFRPVFLFVMSSGCFSKESFVIDGNGRYENRGPKGFNTNTAQKPLPHCECVYCVLSSPVGKICETHAQERAKSDASNDFPAGTVNRQPHMARARLRDRHQESLRRKLQVLKAEQAVTAPQANEDQLANVEDSTTNLKSEPKPGTSHEDDPVSDNERAEEDAANEMLNEYFDAYEAGGYSPKFLTPEDVEPGTIVVTEEDDLKRLEYARLQVVGSGKKVEEPTFSRYFLYRSRKKQDTLYLPREMLKLVPKTHLMSKKNGEESSAIE
ncbi:hypothetical protein NQ318_011204 [Aromia moschata]|uniref:Uncharacterized protein n=1 Tax=Aromia moschata TaxID=1265417 RepID=A0AAV8X2E4_9CUCU|nr:hypothetical protein NQ318_011204 [Aromia moschata]